MIVVDQKKAFAFFRQLIVDTTTAYQMREVSSSSDLLVAYQKFTAQETQPAVYVRALLQSFLNFNNMMSGRLITIKDFVLQDIRMLVLPNQSLPGDGDDMDDIPSEQQLELSSQLDSFLHRCGQSFLNLFRTFCLNRCRVRRTLCHAALEWDQLQAEAEDLDEQMQSALNEQPIPYPAGDNPTFSYSLSSWVYHYKLIQLQAIAQMGFELSIYAPHEFVGMFWYLSFLSSTHLSHLERISHFVSSRRCANQSEQEAVRQTLHRLYRHFTLLKAVEAMSKALHRVFLILQRHGLLQKPTLAYGTNRVRYELRMRPFSHLSIPEPISVDIAEQVSSLQDFSDDTVLDQAVQLNQMAKKAWEEVLREDWNMEPLLQSAPDEKATQDHPTGPTESVVSREWKKDVRNAMRACIGTGIATSALGKALQGNSKDSKDKTLAALRVEIPPVGDRDRWHVSWPVPKIMS